MKEISDEFARAIRFSRFDAPEQAEFHRLREQAPPEIVADKIEENGWHHDQRTLDLLRDRFDGTGLIPDDHALHVAVHPRSGKVVAWTVPKRFESRPRVVHGPGGVYRTSTRPSGQYHIVDTLHPEYRDAAEHEWFESATRASEYAKARAFPAEVT